jgi:hypothetical protein
MNQIPDDFDWNVTTYDGARREQLRRALALTLRERMQFVEDMAEVAERFRQMRETGEVPATRTGPAVAAESEAHALRQPSTQYDPNDE